jgi:hypothetical protein
MRIFGHALGVTCSNTAAGSQIEQLRHLQRNRKFVDSPLERNGFERSVPRYQQFVASSELGPIYRRTSSEQFGNLGPRRGSAS